MVTLHILCNCQIVLHLQVSKEYVSISNEICKLKVLVEYGVRKKSHILVKMTNCTDLLIFIFKHVLNLLHFLRTLLLLKGAI